MIDRIKGMHIPPARGVVYTPAYWAEWAVETYGIAELWMNGAGVLDPGCGRGALLGAVIARAAARGFRPGPADLARLRGVDIDARALGELRTDILERFNLHLPDESLIHGDYLLAGVTQKAARGMREAALSEGGILGSTFEEGADVILANPPWVSFGDLDQESKLRYKPLFRASGLTPDPRSLLLGGSRIDLAALFAAVSLSRDLKPGGRAFFFLPSSLYRGEGAHAAFRRFRLPGNRHFRLDEYRDISAGPPFPGAGTLRCFVSYRADTPQSWPIPWLEAAADGTWSRRSCSPVAEEGSPLVPRSPGSAPRPLPRITVPPGVRPRQGVNTGGASETYIFEQCIPETPELCRVTNRRGERALIRREWIHPLLTPAHFENPREPALPRRWIFLPYHTSGRPLSWESLVRSPSTAEWLSRRRERLTARRGTLIQNLMRRGSWWGLIGIGPYAFAPWKIVWESLGRERFIPRLLSAETLGHWQGNQALHSYLSFSREEDALSVFRALQSPAMEAYLRELGGSRTKGWAQPGRMRRIFVEDPGHMEFDFDAPAAS